MLELVLESAVGGRFWRRSYDYCQVGMALKVLSLMNYVFNIILKGLPLISYLSLHIFNTLIILFQELIVTLHISGRALPYSQNTSMCFILSAMSHEYYNDPDKCSVKKRL